MADPEIMEPETATPEIADNADETPAEAENTENADGADPGDETDALPAADAGAIPYPRFKQVVTARKKAEADLAAAQLEIARLKGIEEGKATPAQPEADDPAKILTRKLGLPPKGLTETEQFEWLAAKTVELHLDRLIQEKFGMSAEAVRANLSTHSTSHRETTIRAFEAECASRGVDPKSKAIRTAIGAVMDAENITTFDKAFDALGISARKPAIPTKPTVQAGAERSAVDSGLLKTVSALPKTVQDAVRMAQAGERIQHVDITDILNPKNGA